MKRKACLACKGIKMCFVPHIGRGKWTLHHFCYWEKGGFSCMLLYLLSQRCFGLQTQKFKYLPKGWPIPIRSPLPLETLGRLYIWNHDYILCLQWVLWVGILVIFTKRHYTSAGRCEVISAYTHITKYTYIYLLHIVNDNTSILLLL